MWTKRCKSESYSLKTNVFIGHLCQLSPCIMMAHGPINVDYLLSQTIFGYVQAAAGAQQVNVRNNWIGHRLGDYCDFNHYRLMTPFSQFLIVQVLCEMGLHVRSAIAWVSKCFLMRHKPTQPLPSDCSNSKLKAFTQTLYCGKKPNVWACKKQQPWLDRGPCDLDVTEFQLKLNPVSRGVKCDLGIQIPWHGEQQRELISGTGLLQSVKHLHKLKKKNKSNIISIPAVCCLRLCRRLEQRLTGRLRDASELKVNYRSGPWEYLSIWWALFQPFRPHKENARIPILTTLYSTGHWDECSDVNLVRS